MNQRHDLLAFSIALLAVALIAWTGVAGPIFAEPSSDGWLWRWQGLIGALLGAAGTIFAGWLAWRGVQFQISRIESERKRRENEAFDLFKIAVAKQIPAAAGARYFTWLGTKGMASSVNDAIEWHVRLLETHIHESSARPLLADLSIDRRVPCLMLLDSLQSIVASWRSDTSGSLPIQIEWLQRQMEGIEKCIRYIDADLTDAFMGYRGTESMPD